MKTKTKKTIINTLQYIVLILVSAFVLLPIAWLFSTAVKPDAEVFLYPPKLIPHRIQMGNFAKAWQSSDFSRFFFNSCVVTFFVVIGQITTSSMAAFSFSRLHYRSRDKLFLAYLATLMIPGQVTMIPCFILIKQLGWQDTYPALILPMIFTAFGTFLLRQFFASIPPELDEAATIDGASYWYIFTRITIPLSKTALATLSVFTFINSWNAFLWPLVAVNSREMSTLTLGLITFRGLYTADWNLIMCATVISILPILVAFLFAQKYFVEGIAMSGIKG